MSRNMSINERIDKSVDAIQPNKPFQSKDLQIKNGKGACNSRKVSSILKGRIRCPENLKGDLQYENGMWMKLEPA